MATIAIASHRATRMTHEVAACFAHAVAQRGHNVLFLDLSAEHDAAELFGISRDWVDGSDRAFEAGEGLDYMTVSLEEHSPKDLISETYDYVVVHTDLLGSPEAIEFFSAVRPETIFSFPATADAVGSLPDVARFVRVIRGAGQRFPVLGFVVTDVDPNREPSLRMMEQIQTNLGQDLLCPPVHLTRAIPVGDEDVLKKVAAQYQKTVARLIEAVKVPEVELVAVADGHVSTAGAPEPPREAAPPAPEPPAAAAPAHETPNGNGTGHAVPEVAVDEVESLADEVAELETSAAWGAYALFFLAIIFGVVGGLFWYTNGTFQLP